MSNQLILNLNTENDSQKGSLVTLTRLSSKIIAFFFLQSENLLQSRPEKAWQSVWSTNHVVMQYEEKAFLKHENENQFLY